MTKQVSAASREGCCCWTEPWNESSRFVNDAALSASEESRVWQALWCMVLLLRVEQMLLIACPQEPSKEAQTSPITVKTKTEFRMGTRKHRSIGSRTRLNNSFLQCLLYVPSTQAVQDAGCRRWRQICFHSHGDMTLQAVISTLLTLPSTKLACALLL